MKKRENQSEKKQASSDSQNTCFIMFNRYGNNQGLISFAKRLVEDLKKENVEIICPILFLGDSELEIMNKSLSAISTANLIIYIGSKEDDCKRGCFSEEVKRLTFDTKVLPIIFDSSKAACLPLLLQHKCALVYNDLPGSKAEEQDRVGNYADNLLSILNTLKRTESKVEISSSNTMNNSRN